jgi:hypothetical protein
MRTFQDHDFLVWEVYSSGGSHGFSDNPNVIFNCLTQQDARPRSVELGKDEADAQRRIAGMSDTELIELLAQAGEIS